MEALAEARSGGAAMRWRRDVDPGHGPVTQLTLEVRETSAGMMQLMVGRCRSPASEPRLKARQVSALETKV